MTPLTSPLPSALVPTSLGSDASLILNSTLPSIEIKIPGHQEKSQVHKQVKRFKKQVPAGERSFFSG
jgi:hypothetical protein